jgi:hypothetical protein
MTNHDATQAYYEAFGALARVYLEDSWVLEILEDRNSVIFRLEVVLTPAHQLYESPASGDQHCYRRGRMTLRSEKPVSLRRSGQPLAMDASGEVDLGNIDTVSRVPGEGDHAWQLTGDWGELLVIEPTVLLEFD